MIERFATDVDRAARTASIACARRGPIYSDHDIVVALRSAAAQLGQVASAKDYAALTAGTKLPSLTTILNRIGGWSNAITAAGLIPGAAADRCRARRWTEEACWDALRQVADELGQIPSVLAYERFATGRGDLPSSATIRNRLGRWSSMAARLAAERELSEQLQVRARSAGDALAGA